MGLVTKLGLSGTRLPWNSVPGPVAQHSDPTSELVWELFPGSFSFLCLRQGTERRGGHTALRQLCRRVPLTADVHPDLMVPLDGFSYISGLCSLLQNLVLEHFYLSRKVPPALTPQSPGPDPHRPALENQHSALHIFLSWTFHKRGISQQVPWVPHLSHSASRLQDSPPSWGAGALFLFMAEYCSVPSRGETAFCLCVPQLMGIWGAPL